MGSIERELREAFEDERGAVTTPETLLTSLTSRVRRRRVSAFAGATVGTLSVVGLAAAIPLAFVRGASSSVAPGASAGTEMTPNPLGLSCGDPVPESLLSSPDRSEIAIYQTVVTSYPAPSVTTKSWPVQSDAVVTEAEFSAVYDARFQGLILAQGGLVVGWTGATAPGTVRITITGLDAEGGATADEPDLDAGRILWCPAAGGDAQVGTNPPSGTYLTYPIVDPNAR